MNFIYIGSTSLIVVGALQYQEKYIKTIKKPNNYYIGIKIIYRNLFINQEKPWCNKYILKCFFKRILKIGIS